MINGNPLWVLEERIRQEYLQKSYQADNIIFFAKATAATVSWLVQWVWVVIRRSTIRGFRYKIFSGIPDEFQKVRVCNWGITNVQNFLVIRIW
jgi:hypothetical protein